MSFGAWIGGAFVFVFGFAWWIGGEAERDLAQREEQWGIRIADGNLVFQDLDCGRRCALIRTLTQSRYSHVGVVVEENGARVVWEALGPVGATPLAEWVARGRGRAIAIYEPTTPIEYDFERFEGRQYDADYQWDDERIYCSELVVKAAGIAIAPRVVALGPHASEVARLSAGRFTAETEVVSPADLARSSYFSVVVDELR